MSKLEAAIKQVKTVYQRLSDCMEAAIDTENEEEGKRIRAVAYDQLCEGEISIQEHADLNVAFDIAFPDAD